MNQAPGLAGVLMSNHFWLTDEQLEQLRLFFPRSHCKPRIDGRRVFSGLIFIGSIGLGMAVLGCHRHHDTSRGASGDALCPRIAAGVRHELPETRSVHQRNLAVLISTQK